LAGHYAGLEQEQAALEAKLSSLLAKLNLQSWFRKFSADLKAAWDSRGQWTSFEEVKILFLHAERIMWSLGLFPWKSGEGQNRVEIPIALDAARLEQAMRERPEETAALLAKFKPSSVSADT